MPVTREQYNAVMQIARVNPGIVVDLQGSTKYKIYLENKKKGKRWMVDGKGEIHRA